GTRGVHQGGERPFAGPLPIRWQRCRFPVFDGRVFAERVLRGYRADDAKGTTERPQELSQASTRLSHATVYLVGRSRHPQPVAGLDSFLTPNGLDRQITPAAQKT